MLEHDAHLAPGTQYTITAADLHDASGNALPLGSELTFTHSSWESTKFYYTPETPVPLIGFWTDSGRLSNIVEAYPFNMFGFYLWCKPGSNGLKALKFALKNPSLQNFHCVIAGAEYDPDYTSSMGDAYSGLSILFHNCKTDWFWAVRYTAFLLDGKGYIGVVPVPNPLTGGIHGALSVLDPLYPLVEMNPVSRLTIDEYLIGTLLQSSSAEYNGTGIEVSWMMREIDEEPEFIISRKKAGAEAFAMMKSPMIDRNSMEFRFIDLGIERGDSYIYRVEYTTGGEIRMLFETKEIATPALPLTPRQNCPNPFNPSTVIGYYLPEKRHFRLEIYDVTGKRVAVLANGEPRPGGYRIEWNGTNAAGVPVSSGIYFCRLTAGKETISKKMVLLK